MHPNAPNSATANVIGHLALLLMATACGLSLRGIPVFVWIIAYLFSAFVAPTAWKELDDASLTSWFVGAVVAGVATGLIYAIGTRFFGSEGQPWLVFRIPGILAPFVALIASSGFIRAVYVRAHRNHGSR
jgi:hypothetical protein